ncbi:elongation factor P [candidate division KSB1 bacterium]|nr:elongation factor P [candidate division KSB1 bacterium]
MATTADFRNGFVFLLDGELFSIVEFQHFKMGRGGAYVRTKLRNLKTGRILERTFRSGEKVAEVAIERRPMQYLYPEGDSLVLMDTSTYEQISIGKELVSTGSEYLKEGETVIVEFNEETPLAMELPIFVNLTVVSTEPGLRGDTVSGATKRAALESGGTVLVPLFIEVGDVLKIDTRTGTYIERVKS